MTGYPFIEEVASKHGIVKQNPSYGSVERGTMIWGGVADFDPMELDVPELTRGMTLFTKPPEF